MPNETLEQIRTVRQARQYGSDAIPAAALAEILEIARWTGSARNMQPWHFIVVDDKEKLSQLSQLRPAINWLAGAPLGIALVLDGNSPTENYDEGRVTERILIAARLLGIGGGVAFYGDESQQAAARNILGVPAEKAARSIVLLGYPTTIKDHRPNPATGGRKEISEVVSLNTFGTASS